MELSNSGGDISSEVTTNTNQLNSDEFRKKISLEPIQSGTIANFQTQTLAKNGNGQLYYRPSTEVYLRTFLGVVILTAFFVLIGFAVIVSNLTIDINFGKYIIIFMIFICLFALGLTFIVLQLFKGNSYIIDTSKKIIYYGLPNQDLSSNALLSGNIIISFNDVYAVQILHKSQKFLSHRGMHMHTTSFIYEINLVLKDTNRINIINTSNYNAVQKDASIIAGCIEVPIWDHTENQSSKIRQLERIKKLTSRFIIGFFVWIFINIIKNFSP